MWKYAVVGNIKKTHIDENGVLRYGTSAFTGNTRVYLCGKNMDENIPVDNKTEIAVLGLDRCKRFNVICVPIDLIENVRFTRIYKPSVLKIMSDYEFAHCW